MIAIATVWVDTPSNVGGNIRRGQSEVQRAGICLRVSQTNITTMILPRIDLSFQSLNIKNCHYNCFCCFSITCGVHLNLPLK